MSIVSRKLCVAPMMDWTDRHCRYFHRLLSPDAVLYSEMITTDAVIFGDRGRLLDFSSQEHPVALQLGGCDPSKLAQAAKIGEALGYDEINFNVGCPSDRVREGRFGACLMAEPEHVKECVGAMCEAVSVPVSVKCRIGIDERDGCEDFNHFIETVAQAPCRVFIVHARKAWLNGLSPKQNREVPPLDYQRVYRLKRARPDLEIIINGGIATLEACERHLRFSDGVMLGRAAYQTPYILAMAQQRLIRPDVALPVREDVLRELVPYVAAHVSRGGRVNNITRYILGLYSGIRGGRAFRRYLSENAVGSSAGVEVLEEAIAIVEHYGELEAALVS